MHNGRHLGHSVDRVFVLLALLISAVGLLTPFILWQRGVHPVKHLELQEIGPFNPLAAWSPRNTDLRMTLGRQQINDVVLILITNTGAGPVLPKDYFRPLSVRVHPPWKIAAVRNASAGFGVPLHWTRVSDRRFDAAPALLNPGDRTSTVVYLTRTAPRRFLGRPLGTVVSCHVRIVNLKSLEPPPSSPSAQYDNRYAFLFVELGGWGLLFTVATALLFEGVHLSLWVRCGLLRQRGWQSLAVVLLLTLLSFSAAEAIATYLYGNTLTDIWGVSNWLNAPPIMLNCGLVLYFWHRARMGTAETRDLHIRAVHPIPAIAEESSKRSPGDD